MTSHVDKFFLRSQTIIGIIVATLPQIDQLVGIAQSAAPYLPPQAAAIVSIVGSAWAAFGRFRKDIKPITIVPQ